MYYILKEEKAEKIFAKYKNAAAFTTSKNVKTPTSTDRELEIEYEQLQFLPDEDTINAIKNGDISAKKVIKKAVKALYRPSADNAAIGLGMAQLMHIITSNRKNEKGPAVLVFLLDPEDEQRNKVMTKFITALFEQFGLTPGKVKKIKKIFKGKKKKVVKAVSRLEEEKGNQLSRAGGALKKMLSVFYELELRNSGLTGLKVTALGNKSTAYCVDSLLATYTAKNLQAIEDDNKSGKKIAKALAKKDKAAVEAYKELIEILKTIDPDAKFPKVKYGAKRKHKKIVGSKMNEKKFKKFYSKRKNRDFILLIYGHTMAVLNDAPVGSKEYNAVMKGTCRQIEDGFDKTFIAAANAYAKTKEPAAN